MFGIRNGGQQASVLMNMDCTQKKGFKNDFKITKVENPKNVDIIKSDKATLDAANKTISFVRGNTQVLKITFQ